ncbi:MAG: ATP-dependent DNA helicase, partial [Ferruginibacter sp.]
RFGQLQQNDPSRFLDEIPDKFLDRSHAGSSAINNQGSQWARGNAFERMNRGFSGAAEKKSTAGPSYAQPSRPSTKVHTPTENFVASDTGNLQAGQQVEHQKFGFGEVTKMEGAAHNPVATILFKHNGEKKIMLNYAKLRIVPEEENEL